ncbi:AMP-binding protein [Streptomyces globosus]|uniref:AMP-binding protein n=1 Tax=Streptomyces globosus TaxID=68209 RepID=UPI00381D04C5
MPGTIRSPPRPGLRPPGASTEPTRRPWWATPVWAWPVDEWAARVRRSARAGQADAVDARRPVAGAGSGARPEDRSRARRHCLTYAALHRRASRTAAGVRLLGLRPGRRVVVRLPNVPEYVITLFALLRRSRTASRRLRTSSRPSRRGAASAPPSTTASTTPAMTARIPAQGPCGAFSPWRRPGAANPYGGPPPTRREAATLRAPSTPRPSRGPPGPPTRWRSCFPPPGAARPARRPGTRPPARGPRPGNASPSRHCRRTPPATAGHRLHPAPAARTDAGSLRLLRAGRGDPADAERVGREPGFRLQQVPDIPEGLLAPAET